MKVTRPGREVPGATGYVGYRWECPHCKAENTIDEQDEQREAGIGGIFLYALAIQRLEPNEFIILGPDGKHTILAVCGHCGSQRANQLKPPLSPHGLAAYDPDAVTFIGDTRRQGFGADDPPAAAGAATAMGTGLVGFCTVCTRPIFAHDTFTMVGGDLGHQRCWDRLDARRAAQKEQDNGEGGAGTADSGDDHDGGAEAGLPD